MTHDELLTHINWLCEPISADIDDTFTVQSLANFAALNSLRAVVELHLAKEDLRDGLDWGFRCRHCDCIYPCPTIQTIEGELL